MWNNLSSLLSPFLHPSLPPSFLSSLSYVLLVNIIKRNTQSKNTWITHPQKDCLGIPDSSWFHDWWSPSWTTEPHSLQCPRRWVGVNRRLLTHSGVSKECGVMESRWEGCPFGYSESICNRQLNGKPSPRVLGDSVLVPCRQETAKQGCLGGKF